MLTTEELAQIAEQEGVPLPLFLATYAVESSSGRNAKTSSKGAVGGFQLLPDTFSQMVPGGNINNEYHNAVAGARYLKEGLEKGGGDYREAALYYHGGPDKRIWGPLTNAHADKVVKEVQGMQSFSAKISEGMPVTAALGSKPRIQNPDGSFSTERTITVESGGQHFLIPTIVNGKQVSAAEAVTLWEQNQNPEVGKFATAEEANKAAVARSSQIGKTAMVETPEFSRLAEQISANTLAADRSLQKSREASEQYQADYNRSAAQRVAKLNEQGDLYALIGSAIATTKTKQAIGVTNTLANFGLDDESINNLQAYVSTKIRTDVEKLVPMREQLTAKADAIPEPLSNPLGWLLGSLSIRKDISQHNNLLSQIQQDKRLFDGLVQSAQGLQTLNVAKKSAGEASQALAESALNVAIAQEKAIAVQQEAAKGNQVFATQEFKNDFDALQISLARLRILEAADARAERDETKAAKRLVDETTLKVKNDGLKMLGYQEVSTLAAYYKLPKRQQDSVETVIASGGNRFGRDFVEAYENVKSGDPRKQTNDTRAMIAIADEVYKEASKDLQGKTLPKTGNVLFETLKAEQQRQILNNEIKDKFEALQMNTAKNPVPEMKSNPYRAPPIEQILSDPKFEGTELAGVLKQTMQQMPAKEITPDYVIAVAKSELSKGIYAGSVEAAANDLQMYFKRVMDLNNQAMMFTKWNLPEQKHFGFGDGKDWAKRGTITTELVKSLSWSFEDIFKLAIPGRVRNEYTRDK